MESSVLVAIISGIITLIGTCVTVFAGLRSSAQKAAVQQAVTDQKLSELTREVRKHNDFAERLPVVEEQIKVINHRISDLEEVTKHG